MARQTFAQYEADRLAKQAGRALAARVGKIEAERHERRRLAFVDEMLATGRISADERASIERAFDASPEATIALLATRPVPVVRAATAEETRAYADATAERLSIPKDRIV